jgi:Tol biopolymer transport system component
MLVGAVAACSPLNQNLGTLEGPSLTGDAGTGATLTGTQIPPLPPEWGTCNPNVLRCFQDPGLPASPPVAGLFSGTADPDPTHKPTIVYPLGGSIHPINLADITFQWLRRPAVAQTVFRIRLRRINGDVFELYVPCNHANTLGPPVSVQCVYHLPPGAWIDLATTAHGETLAVDISGVDPTHPGVVATSDPMQISFSPQDLRGAFYYWSTNIQGALRVLFGARTAQPFIVQKSPSNPTSLCSGCHTVSRDGSTIAFTQGDNPAEGILRVEATSDPSKALFTPSTKHDSATLALNHDGSRVLVSVGGQLILRDATTGTPLGSVPDALLGAGQHGFHPEWSPDDKNIAITLSDAGDSDWSVSTGSIAVLPYNGGTFGPVDVIVPSGAEFNFYPTWSPDGHWIAFTTAPVGALQTSYVQTNAHLRLANRDTHQVFDLTNATSTLGRVSAMPKFAPFPQSGGLMFLTFKSKIDYGFFLPNNDGGPPQLWITAIDPTRAQQVGDDPSSPPVWLPFQSVAERNYLGTWSERVGCRLDAAGRSTGCGSQEICSSGACAIVAP